MADDRSPSGSRETSNEPSTADAQLKRALELIRLSLTDLRFGQVCVTVQDGVVVQIERTEKTRLR